MQQIIYFFIRNKNFLLFFTLFLISLFFTVQSHSFHKNKFVHSANFLSGGLYTFKSNITNYFNLKQENNKLVEENIYLHTQIEKYHKYNQTSPDLDSAPFTFIKARVINNNYSKTKNRLTINVGKKDSVEVDMGVIGSNGIVGVIDQVSNNFATVQSILNNQSQINAKLKKSNHFGSLVWDTENPNIVQLVEIPRLAPIIKGDTIITGGMSTIFPEGLSIGVVTNFSLTQDQNSYVVDIQLFNDMTQLGTLYILKNNNKIEILQLEKEGEDAE